MKTLKGSLGSEVRMILKETRDLRIVKGVRPRVPEPRLKRDRDLMEREGEGEPRHEGAEREKDDGGVGRAVLRGGAEASRSRSAA